MTSVAIANKAEILQRIASGEPLTAIAHAFGYTDHSGIIHRLDDDPDYKLALRKGVVAKIEKREGELELATDNVTVTRADRLLNHARWWAGVWDKQFSQKPDVSININNLIHIDQAMPQAAAGLLDHLRTVADQQQSGAASPELPFVGESDDASA